MFVKQKSILTAVILAAFVFVGFIKSGDAVETTVPVNHKPIVIEELRSYNDRSTEYNYSSSHFTFYIKTDRPYSYIFWFVDDVYEGMSVGDGNNTDTYFGFPNLPGNIKGKEYEIKAIAWPPEPGNFLVDTEIYDFMVVKPVVTEGYGPNSGFWGSAEVKRHYFNGTTFVMEAKTYASNPTNETLRAGAWFQQRKYKTKGDSTAGDLVNIKRDPHIEAPLEFEDVAPGESLSDSPNSMMVDIGHGGLIGDSERVWLDAHTHLQVHSIPTDDWEADTGVHVFTAEDNPE